MLESRAHQVVVAMLVRAGFSADLNGKAAEVATRRIKGRLATFAATRYGGAEGVGNVVFADDAIAVNGISMPFGQLFDDACRARVQLWSDGFYATPDLHWDKDSMTGRPFYYFAYGAAVSLDAVEAIRPAQVTT